MGKKNTTYFVAEYEKDCVDEGAIVYISCPFFQLGGCAISKNYCRIERNDETLDCPLKDGGRVIVTLAKRE